MTVVNWETSYREYRDIIRRWSRVGRLLTEDRLLYPGTPLKRAWEEVDETFSVLRNRTSRKQIKTIRKNCERVLEASQPFQNVYQAALYIAGSQQYWYGFEGDEPDFFADHSPRDDWTPEARIRRLYRGQRDTSWDVEPKYLRPDKHGGPPPTEQELERREAGVVEAVCEMMQLYPSFSEQQALAVVQHYSDVLDVDPWLVDVTRDPFVALFFASRCGHEGQVGRVYLLATKPYGDFIPPDQPCFGRIQPIQVPFIPRVEAQRALFVDCPHPHLWDAYVPFTIEFHQQEGLVFEDPTLGITRDRLLPETDPVSSQAKEIAPRLTDVKPDLNRSLEFGPWVRTREPLDPAVYRELVSLWPECKGLPEDPQVERLIQLACGCHAFLWAKGGKDIGRAPRSLRKLAEALTPLALQCIPGGGPLPKPKQIISPYLRSECQQVRELADNYLACQLGTLPTE